MLRITLQNSTSLSQDDLVDILRRYTGGTRIGDRKPIGDIRISPRTGENAVVLTLGKSRGIEKDLFIAGNIESVRKMVTAFEDVKITEPDIPDDTPPVNNDENTVVDAYGNPV